MSEWTNNWFLAWGGTDLRQRMLQGAGQPKGMTCDLQELEYPVSGFDLKNPKPTMAHLGGKMGSKVAGRL